MNTAGLPDSLVIRITRCAGHSQDLWVAEQPA